MNYRIIIPALLIATMTSVAAAQTSEITGTLTAGATSTGLTGTVTPTPGGGSLTGTVVAPTGGGGGGGVNGPPVGGGGGGGSNVIDICPNLADVQSSLPAGYVLVNGNCVLSSGTGTGTGGTAGSTGAPTGTVLGETTDIPNIPNTGAGGDAAGIIVSLVLSSAIAAAAGLMLRRSFP